MKLHLWGTDFRRSPSEFRSRLFLPLDQREGFVREMLGLGFRDLVYLTTCNRVEFFTTASDYFRGTRAQWIKLLHRFGLGDDAYYQGYHLEGKSALRHMLRVATSLESLVVGETQILGQLKDALKWTQERELPILPSLDRAFALCFHTAKRVRSETAIGDRPVSVASLGLRHLQSLEPEHPLRRAVVVGRNPICRLIVQWLLDYRPQCPVIWVNRTWEPLKAIPQSARTEVVSLSLFLETPPDFSHLFTSTSSPDPLFGPDFFSKLSKGKRLYFDFAQPPDIALCSGMERTGRLLHMEDFSREAKQNAQARKQAVELVESLIDEALRDYCREQKETPLLRKFSSGETQVVEELVESISAAGSKFPVALQLEIKEWTQRLVKKSWHRSREHLKDILHQINDPEEQVPLV